MIEEPCQTSGHPELAKYKQNERLPSPACVPSVPFGSACPSAHLQEHKHTAPNALAHTCAPENAGMGSSSF